jgi:TonB-linked SusC/RagA family outer membrane protein
MPMKNLLIILLCFFPLAAISQVRTVTGKVTDDTGLPLIGVTVMIKGTTTGSITDLDGNYSISNVPVRGTLVYSFIGMVTEEVAVENRSIINVTLKDATIGLDEVVVVGYGVQIKESAVGSIEQIDGEILRRAGGTSLSNALTGQIPGVSTLQRSGEPGADAANIFIRGKSSWVDSSPLVLVDGVERNFNDIDPNEIETLSVLKDASATAVFGIKGANGVILITTKRGREGRTQLTYSSELTMKQPLLRRNMFESYETALLLNEAHRNDNNWHLLLSDKVLEHFRLQDEPYLYPNTDWAEHTVNDFGWAQKHNINVTAGNNFARVFSSLTYTYDGDIYNTVKQPDYNPEYRYDRYNYRTNLDVNATRSTVVSLDVGGFVGFRNRPYETASIRVHRPIYMLGPMEIPFMYPAEILEQYPDRVRPDETGDRYANTGVMNAQNPYNSLNNSGFKQERRTEINTTLQIKQDLEFITKGLSFQGKAAFGNSEAYEKQYALDEVSYKLLPNGTWLRYKGTENRDSEGPVVPIGPGAENFSSPPFRRWYYEASVNYARSFDKHHVSGLLLGNRQERQNDLDFPRFEEGIVGRVTYNYGYRYLFEANLGINGSEQFSPENRYGVFPSFAVGWNLHQEKFFQNLVPFMERAKVRYSYGEVGSDNMGGQRWLYVSEYLYGTTNNFGYMPGTLTSTGRTITPLLEGQVANLNTTWERSKKENLGIELGFFKNNMIQLNMDFFHEKRDQILLNRLSLPAWFGVNAKAQNLGATESKGYELDLRFNYRLRNGMRYWLRGGYNYSDNRIIERDEPMYKPNYQQETGKRINQMFGYASVGFINNLDERAAVPRYPSGIVGLGDVVYIDFNGDGVIDDNDQVPMEYPGQYPLTTYNFSGGFAYKGFDLDVNFQGATDMTRFLVDAFLWPLHRLGNQYFDYQSNYWRPDNMDNPDFPAIRTDANRIANNIRDGQRKTIAMRDASYLRLKTAQIGYSIPREAAARIHVSGLRLYLQGTNLLTWTDIPIGDPEGTDEGNGNVTFGYYPLIKRFTLGLQVTF